MIIPFLSFAQTATVKGTVKDRVNSELIPEAMVKLNGDFRVLTDFDGAYEFQNVPFGNYQMVIAYSDYDTVMIKLVVDKAIIIQDVKIGGSAELEEIRIIGNISTDRKTPIAITKISAAKIQEELASRDLPMLLNGTPGVYATQQGGGDGDARITVRGFDQRNIGVLIDGVPVNDMENGAVYWSNWFGLDNITSQIQLQRGLGATKLSMPSVGGSMNIISSGIGSRKGFTFKQEYATGEFLRTSLSYNSGLMKNGMGVTFSGSYKQGKGWVEGLSTQGGFFYLKVQKKWAKHLLSFSAFAAPQQHGQRSFNQKIQYWDADRSTELGAPVDQSQAYNRGIRFNQHFGYITENGKKVLKNERLNYYVKPQITLKDFWTVNKKLSISNIGYISIGRGGGTAMSNSGAVLYTPDGHVDWDAIVKANREDQIFGGPSVDPQYSATELKSTQVQIANVNNHFWVGYLGQVNYELNKNLVLSGGVDYRFYKGTHYQYIKDILGGDYYINGQNKNEANLMKREGDKIGLNTFNNYRDGFVQWAGVFGTAEYSNKRWTAFLNVSGVVNAYKGVDYFQKKWLEVGDTTLRIGANDTINYNGQQYTASSDGLEYNHTSWKTIPGATIKAGANYTLNETSNVFMNLGYLSRTPQFSNVIDNNTNTFFKEIKNEVIQAIELGYTFSNKKIGINLNGYFTNWKNKPFPYGVSIPNPQDPSSNIYLNINGMDAIHKGAEIDVEYRVSKKITTEVMFSMGDWRWNSSNTLYIPDYNYSFSFDAKGVHVGNAAQTMLSASIRFEPIKNLYFKAQYQFFDRFYADFNPFSLQGANGGRDSWKIPAYGLVNLFAGYSHKFDKFSMFFNGAITNLLGSAYIADATNNFYAPNSFDSQSASVMFGQGFRFNVSVGINF